MKKLVLFFFLLTFFNLTYSQYYIRRSETLPDTTIGLGPMYVPIALNREDVKAVGMGKAQVAAGKTFNAMMYNPALLSERRFTVEGLNLQFSLPPQTYDAANFLKNNYREFKEALSLKAVWQGVKNLKAAVTVQQQLNALHEIQNGLKFPRDLLNEVVGTSENPKIHGLRISPGIGIQTGNFGFSIYGISQTGFQMQQSPIIDALLQVQIPDDVNNQQEIINAIVSLEAPLAAIIDDNGNVNTNAYPVAFAFSILDIVGSAGYGMHITPVFAVGANLKVIHRRFSTKRIVVDKYDNILSEVRKDLDSYITGFTFDIGGLFQFPTGTNIGFSLQNIIPVKKLTSHLRAREPFYFLDYDRDNNGNIIVNGQDTALVNYTLNVNVDFPFDLKLPFIVNLGASQAITRNFDVALDIVDAIEQEKLLYEKYTERIRVGTEYRLHAIEDNLVFAGRIGFAEEHPTFGLGINLFKALQLDAAYAWDNFVDSYSYFAQVRLGW